jgi:hypothetical protein
MSQVEVFSEAAAAAAGGFFSCSVLYPIEICKNKLQAPPPLAQAAVLRCLHQRRRDQQPRGRRKRHSTQLVRKSLPRRSSVLLRRLVLTRALSLALASGTSGTDGWRTTFRIAVGN